ncbi:class I SAM-dependent methyltransferase [Pyrococcus sp. ST04]|uniref:class I SAM-dependent methyltransferase n=1 Tax=Pyrococcus sp. ST04 TaxID=1183377 RepID=UPI0002605A55|nr:class I SAM-dependent methyltransferase [Pyrococcus sp. ST04]AFK22022.1 SAM-dependent methyltransferase [Pyrococcus sp. ST04]
MHELYTVLARYYDSIYRRRIEEIRLEIDFLEEIFKNDAEREVRRVLDLACGTGIPSLELARRGYEVVGVDLHEEMLKIAREKAKSLGLNIRFIREDALKISFSEEFDAVTMLFSSIAYFDEDSLVELLRRVYKALREGGVFVADFGMWFSVKSNHPVIWSEFHGEEKLILIDWREVFPGIQKMRFRRVVQIIKPDGTTKSFLVDDELNLYTPREMSLIGKTIFKKVSIYSDYQRKLSERPRRIWAVFIK